MAKPKYFASTSTGVATRYLRWDDFSVSAFRDFNEVFRPNEDWEVKVDSHVFGFYKSGAVQATMAPGDWVQLTTWSDSSTPSIVSDSSLRSGHTELFGD